MEAVVQRARRAVESGVAQGMVVAWRNGERFDGMAAGARGPGGAPPDTCTPFPVASITKPMTAALVAALGRAGRLDLHAPVLGDASLRDLVRHAGGVGPDWPIGRVEDLERTERIERLGAPWSYGNPGFARRPSRRTGDGRSFAGALREHVLEPAGMADTRAEPWAEDDPAALAHDTADPAGRPTSGCPRGASRRAALAPPRGTCSASPPRAGPAARSATSASRTTASPTAAASTGLEIGSRTDARLRPLGRDRRLPGAAVVRPARRRRRRARGRRGERGRGARHRARRGRARDRSPRACARPAAARR